MERRMLIGRHFGNVWKMLLMVAPLFLLQSAKAQQNTHEVNGKVTFKIETKRLTLQQAQAAKNDKTPISLKVSLIFEGEWVSLFDQKFRAYANSSAFAFGIAKTSGDNLSTSAPLYEVDPPAWIYSAPLLHCTAPDGGSLEAQFSEGVYIEDPNWERQNGVCPIFAYGTGFSNTSNMNNSSFCHRTTHEGKECYELDLFNLYFRLKDLQTVYVRGVDCNNASDGVASTDNESDLGGATVGTTILNIINTDGAACYWPGASNTENADWTLAGSADYYGGVIPGGIFIEQVPELTQFERSLMA